MLQTIINHLTGKRLLDSTEFLLLVNYFLTHPQLEWEDLLNLEKAACSRVDTPWEVLQTVWGYIQAARKNLQGKETDCHGPFFNGLR